MLTLPATKRTSTPQELRREGMIPAVVYGGHHESISVAVDVRAFQKVLREAGEATIISLTGLGQPVPVLIHEVALDPLTSLPQHIDFYAVTQGELIEIEIPITFVGESPAARNGANVVKVTHELEVKADPMHLPQTIEVNLALLTVVGDQIHAGDIALPVGVTLVSPVDEVIALAQEVVEEKAEAAADIGSIEVEKKGKEEVAAETK